MEFGVTLIMQETSW